MKVVAGIAIEAGTRSGDTVGALADPDGHMWQVSRADGFLTKIRESRTGLPAATAARTVPGPIRFGAARSDRATTKTNEKEPRS